MLFIASLCLDGTEKKLMDGSKRMRPGCGVEAILSMSLIN
jgi:hypothetical protein